MSVRLDIVQTKK